jgi:hypothetical protein
MPRHGPGEAKDGDRGFSRPENTVEQYSGASGLHWSAAAAHPKSCFRGGVVPYPQGLKRIFANKGRNQLKSSRREGTVTIAACYVSPEGVVLGADSTSTYGSPTLPSGSPDQSPWRAAELAPRPGFPKHPLHKIACIGALVAGAKRRAGRSRRWARPTSASGARRS